MVMVCQFWNKGGAGEYEVGRGTYRAATSDKLCPRDVHECT